MMPHAAAAIRGIWTRRATRISASDAIPHDAPISIAPWIAMKPAMPHHHATNARDAVCVYALVVARVVLDLHFEAAAFGAQHRAVAEVTRDPAGVERRRHRDQF